MPLFKNINIALCLIPEVFPFKFQLSLSIYYNNILSFRRFWVIKILFLTCQQVKTFIGLRKHKNIRCVYTTAKQRREIKKKKYKKGTISFLRVLYITTTISIINNHGRWRFNWPFLVFICTKKFSFILE